jgi:putative transposase
VRYVCIARHRGSFPVGLMCRVLAVSRSGFYAWLRRDLSDRRRRDERLLVEVRAIHRASRRRYGSPRVHEELCARGIRCGRKRVERLMRAAGVRAKKRRKFRVTTQSEHSYAPAPNLVARQFAVGSTQAAGRVWAADITYLWTREGWVYLAVILDVATRRVVGWAVRSRLASDLTLAALDIALQREGAGEGMHHSDRGVQYACRAYRDRLARHGITVSMSRRGDCWDNAVVESFMATLKWELVADADWQTRREASQALFEYIEIWYNRQRRHSSLGYQTPVEYAAQLAQQQRAA